MKKLTAILMLATALATPSLAYAKDATLNVDIASYRGPPTYFAVYLTKADGSYDSTLWVAGGQPQYYRHLRGWIRAISATNQQIDGITSASVGAGRSVQAQVPIADALIDAGYQIHIDSAVENGGEYRDNIVLDLTSANAGKTVSGDGYVSQFSVKF